jgi:hypothetical protein
MKMHTLVISTLATLCFSQIGFTADPPNKEGAPGMMTPEVMQRMTPNENHKALNDIVGKFKYSMKWWMNPDSKAEESKGTSTAKWIMNGRFVQQDVKSKMNGQEFQGTGFTGYDNVKQAYQSVWLDNMGTGMMFSDGTKTEDNTIATSGTVGCPMTGDKNHWFRNELKVLNKNEHTFISYAKSPEGKEYKSMEINYKRVN